MEKKWKYIKISRLEGGGAILKKIMVDNLQYPFAVIENNVKGDVVVKIKVMAQGEVFDAAFEHRIGYSCNQETLRLASLPKYEAAKHQRGSVTGNSRIKIPFRLKPKTKPPKINMVYKTSTKGFKTQVNVLAFEKKPETYLITLKF